MRPRHRHLWARRNWRSVEPARRPITVAAGDFISRSITLGKGRSIVVDFSRDIKDVLIANPKVANAVVRSSRRAYIIAIDNGGTNIVFFDAEGKQLVNYDIAVSPMSARSVLPSSGLFPVRKSMLKASATASC